MRRYRVNDRIDTSLDVEEFGYDIALVDDCTVLSGPMIPAHVHMRPYQIDAIEAWTKQNYVGIFDMATGTGKTYTALAAIAKLYADMNQNLAVIIICPYTLLLPPSSRFIE